MEYFIWKAQYTEGVCVIMAPDVERIWELDRGISRINGFPSDTFCEMNPDFPKNIQLADYLYGANIPVIYSKLKEFLEKEVVINTIEYLPVRIINHKGRVASEDYFILNPLDVCDCIDLDRSGVVWNRIRAKFISGCKGLVLRHEAIPMDYKLFRLKYWEHNIIVSADLVDTLTAAELTGLRFLNVTGYTGIG